MRIINSFKVLNKYVVYIKVWRSKYILKIVARINLDPIYQREKKGEWGVRKFRRQINIKREKD